MNASILQHQYQAWCQGNDYPARDWSHFVEWAARLNNTTGDQVMRILQTTYWFQRPSNTEKD